MFQMGRYCSFILCRHYVSFRENLEPQKVQVNYDWDGLEFPYLSKESVNSKGGMTLLLC